MFANERYSKIIEIINNKGSVTVSELMQTFNVSIETVRRDLNPTEMAIFLSIIGNSITNMDPVWKVTLEAAGTGNDEIWEHYLRFITPAIETRHELDLSGAESGDEK